MAYRGLLTISLWENKVPKGAITRNVGVASGMLVGSINRIVINVALRVRRSTPASADLRRALLHTPNTIILVRARKVARPRCRFARKS